MPSPQLETSCVGLAFLRAMCRGNYWRRMPGKYAHITTSPSGDLWALDEKGQVWKQEWRAMVVSQDPDASRGELEMSMVVDQTWEVV